MVPRKCPPPSKSTVSVTTIMHVHASFFQAVGIIDSDSFSSEDDDEKRPRLFEPHPPAGTLSESRSVFPVSMATFCLDANDPPEYMSIETPPSSPELSQMGQPCLDNQLDQSDISRTKTSDWIKQVSIDTNQYNQSSLSKSDSAKKLKRRKFVPGGLAERLQRVIQRENSEIRFWEHRSTSQQQESQQGKKF